MPCAGTGFLRATALALPPVVLLAAAARSQVTLPTQFVNEIVASGFDQPTSFAFLPDGRVLVTEQRTGNVRLVVSGRAAHPTALAIGEMDAVAYERGLQSIAVDPRWPLEPYVYVHYTHAGGFARVERWTGSGDLDHPRSDALSFESPLVVLDRLADRDPIHNAGCLRFGPDGMLYLSLGDDNARCSAQDPATLSGAILRLDVRDLRDDEPAPVARERLVPPDNPLAHEEGDRRLVWAWGMRNPWRFHFDPVAGTLIAVDVGHNVWEELNEIEPGGNYGWPIYEGPNPFSEPGCAPPGGATFTPPAFALHRTPAPTAIAGGGFYRPGRTRIGAWPSEYHGNLFWAEYYSGNLHRLVRSDNAWVTGPPVAGQPSSEIWARGLANITDMLAGADGAMYWTSQFGPNGGTLNRIRWAGGSAHTLAGGALLSTAPNPFASSCAILPRITAPTRVSLQVHDLRGRRVRDLFSGTAQVGTAISWDGRDDEGRALESGLYVVRMTAAGGYRGGARVLLVR